ncbi:MAG: helix-turn-helix domain-containing protein [Gemmatimonadetes bacterium]|nr:helix-turn-helix domain-containing protein [Gemmatimonadota bacterium]
MNVHKNAALAPRGREQMVERLEAGESGAAAAAAVGVSERTVWKWRARWREGGREQM